MSMNDLNRPHSVRNRDNSGIGWAVAAGVAVLLIGAVWMWSNRDHTVANSSSPITTGQSTQQRAPVFPAPIVPNQTPNPSTPSTLPR
jgi:hypothetical protein